MSKLTESLEQNDLKDRLESTIHIDEYKPKMGDEDDTIVVSFKVFGKQPAYDFETFLERGYSWILDAETSTGEISDGNYLVFLEAERRTNFPKKLVSLLSDIHNITEIKDWNMIVYDINLDENKQVLIPVSEQTLINNIALSPKSYRDMKATANVLESMLNTARVPRKQGDINGFRAFERRFRD
jgi:hypothetical protein